MFTINVYGQQIKGVLDVADTPKGRSVQLMDTELSYSMPYARLSVFVPANVTTPCSLTAEWTDQHFWLKDWSENEAIVAALIEEGVIEIDNSIQPIPSGYVEIKAAFIK